MGGSAMLGEPGKDRFEDDPYPARSLTASPLARADQDVFQRDESHILTQGLPARTRAFFEGPCRSWWGGEAVRNQLRKGSSSNRSLAELVKHSRDAFEREIGLKYLGCYRFNIRNDR